ncbi:hypothetical protein [Capnocytophaga canis]|uniref:Uncharacterized protein n=1 Tax=Capnocytophaga canis TaxID=1848903 RepID=A0A0B7I1G1_9FLAO|nr:hypothetical protein [Capnocytophaga canis]CEN43977.1 hypothetical protein CCAND38_150016 [Capnocytophaga canis]
MSSVTATFNLSPIDFAQFDLYSTIYVKQLGSLFMPISVTYTAGEFATVEMLRISPDEKNNSNYLKTSILKTHQSIKDSQSMKKKINNITIIGNERTIQVSKSIKYNSENQNTAKSNNQCRFFITSNFYTTKIQKKYGNK